MEAAFEALEKRTAACRRCTGFGNSEPQTVVFFDPPTGQKAASGVYCKDCFAIPYGRFYRTGVCAVCRRDGDVTVKTVHPYANNGLFCAAHLHVARAEKAARNRADRAKRARRSPGDDNVSVANTWETTSTYANQLTDNDDEERSYAAQPADDEDEEPSHATMPDVPALPAPQAIAPEPAAPCNIAPRIAALCTFLDTAPDDVLRARMVAYLNERPDEARATFDQVLRVAPGVWDRVLRALLHP
jgi:hypothetical protein